MIGTIVPNFAHGFARSASEASFPGLWKDLVGLWAPILGKQGQTLYDWSGLANHGTLVNMTNDDWIPDKNGWSLDFDGSNDRVNIGNPDSLNITNEITIEAWIKTTDTNGAIINKDAIGGGTRQYAMYFAGNQLVIIFFNPATFVIAPAGVGNDGKWHHILGRLKGTSFGGDGKAYLYIDGKLLGVSAGTLASISSTGSPLWIGNRIDGFALDGQIGKVSIYNRALSDTEISLLATIPYAPLILDDELLAFLILGRLSRYHDLTGLGGQGQMTWNPLG